jgi:selenocysteine lyase/cysteine desulfurase
VARGGTVSFSLVDRDGAAVPFGEVVDRLGRHRVSVRGGCFCNPGCVEAAFALPAASARECRASLGPAYDAAAFASCIGGPVGAVRASVGIPTVAEDIDRLARALAQEFGAR